jgi:glycosyltransferase involved in cell wall biosynthesis
MFNNRILITTYPESFLVHGGGEVELIEIRDSLKRLGRIVDIYGPESLPLSKYDTVFHYSVIPSGIGNLERAKKHGKKTVLMPALWWNKQPTDDEITNLYSFLSLSDFVVFKSRTELNNLLQYASIDAQKIILCNWGVDPVYGFPCQDESLFKNSHKLPSFILCVGIIEPNKNQLSVIQALKNYEVPVVFIGDYRNRNYFEECIKTAPNHFKFMHFLPPKSEMLRAAYSECLAFIELSNEPPGFSAIEAGLSGAKLVLSRSKWVDEILGDGVVQVNQYSHSEIIDGMNQAISSRPNEDLVMKIRANNLLPQSLLPLAKVL